MVFEFWFQKMWWAFSKFCLSVYFLSNMLDADIMSSFSSSLFSRWQVLTAQSDTEEEVWYLAYSATQTCLLMGDELDLIIHGKCIVCNICINYLKQFTKILSVHFCCQCGCRCFKILGHETSAMSSSEDLSSSTQHICCHCYL